MISRKFRIQNAMSILALVVVFTIGFFAAGIKAQEGPPPIPDGAKKLQAFLGDWSGTITSTQNGETKTGTVHHINTSIGGGWGISVMETGEIEGMQPYKALNMFGYDMGTGLTHLYTVDNYADCHDHKGKWSDEKTLNLEHDGVVNGKPAKEVLKIMLDSPTQYSYEVQGFFDGKPSYTMKATLHKK